MTPNELLAGIERARLWSYFHKDWLLQIRAALRPQLPPEYHLFVESEAILISPDEGEIGLVTLPDVSVARRDGAAAAQAAPHRGTAAVLEVDEPYEVATQYSLVIRRSPENFVTAACELVSPSTKVAASLRDAKPMVRTTSLGSFEACSAIGFGSRSDPATIGMRPLDREQHVWKRTRLLEAGVSLLEIDALTRGERVLPDAVEDLARYSRNAWTAFHQDGRRQWRGWGWNEEDPLPEIPWNVDASASCTVDLDATCREANEFNSWESVVRGTKRK